MEKRSLKGHGYGPVCPDEINAIGDYYAYSREIVNGDSVFDFDVTKLSIHTLDIGLAGIEVYDILRDEYDIQVEFGDLGNILASCLRRGPGSGPERLVSALQEIRRRFKRGRGGMLSQEYISPQVAATPRRLFMRKRNLAAERKRGPGMQ